MRRRGERREKGEGRGGEGREERLRPPQSVRRGIKTNSYNSQPAIRSDSQSFAASSSRAIKSRGIFFILPVFRPRPAQSTLVQHAIVAPPFGAPASTSSSSSSSSCGRNREEKETSIKYLLGNEEWEKVSRLAVTCEREFGASRQFRLSTVEKGSSGNGGRLVPVSVSVSDSSNGPRGIVGYISSASSIAPPLVTKEEPVPSTARRSSQLLLHPSTTADRLSPCSRDVAA
ncbi:hypothetical protein OPV22_021386 [Ensete ventricosum]|uniref:Uncharacterized protein n=1 Tax=Ensete ventricosum TaxID=4639 RepID=A0AAV8QLV9_ENSVE|nr:hypothetical protein OPV22_021386 [Ensete ventricosum]